MHFTKLSENLGGGKNTPFTPPSQQKYTDPYHLPQSHPLSFIEPLGTTLLTVQTVMSCSKIMNISNCRKIFV